jgi:hypothetical protein
LGEPHTLTSTEGYSVSTWPLKSLSLSLLHNSRIPHMDASLVRVTLVGSGSRSDWHPSFCLVLDKPSRQLCGKGPTENPVPSKAPQRSTSVAAPPAPAGPAGKAAPVTPQLQLLGDPEPEPQDPPKYGCLRHRDSEWHGCLLLFLATRFQDNLLYSNKQLIHIY